MAESSINVTEGSGKRLHTWDRTISSVLVQGQFVLPGEFPYPTYLTTAYNISTATANSHIIQLMAGSSNVVRVRRIMIRQKTAAGTAAVAEFDVLRLTTAGTSGSSLGVNRLNVADSTASATSMSLPTSKGTESTSVAFLSLLMSGAATTVGAMDTRDEWEQHPGMEPIIIPAGTSNGIAVKNLNAIASGTVTVVIEFVETSFV